MNVMDDWKLKITPVVRLQRPSKTFVYSLGFFRHRVALLESVEFCRLVKLIWTKCLYALHFANACRVTLGQGLERRHERLQRQQIRWDQVWRVRVKARVRVSDLIWSHLVPVRSFMTHGFGIVAKYVDGCPCTQMQCITTDRNNR